MKKRTSLLLILLALICASAVGYIRLQLPKMESLAKFYIAQMSSHPKVPVEIVAERIGVRAFPPRVILHGIQIQPKESIKKHFQGAAVEKITIEPSILDFAFGKFWLHKVAIENAKVTARISTKKKSSPSEPVLFSRILEQTRVSEILLQGIELNLTIDKKNVVQTKKLYVRAYNQKNSLLAKIKSPDLNIGNLSTNKNLPVHLDTQFMLTDNNLSISKLKLIKNKAYLIASGNLRFENNYKKVIEARLSSRLNGDIQDTLTWASTFIEEPLPKLFKGHFKMDLSLDKEAQSPFALNLEGGLDQFSIGKVLLGNIRLEGHSSNLKDINFSKINFALPGEGNTASISQIAADIRDRENIKIKAKVQVPKVQLHSFLSESHIATIPVWLQITGDLDCSGVIGTSTAIRCPAKVKLNNFKVNGSKKAKSRNIASFKTLEAAGDVLISEKEISYSSELSMPTSKGISSGVINFKKGFDIKFESNAFSFNELGSISEFPVSGSAVLKGSTQGNSKTALFDIDISAKNFEFENYFFGDLTTKLNYRRGTLFFNKTEGHIDSTRFTGAFEVDLLAERVSGDFTLPFFKMKDVQQAVIKKVDLKNRFLGSGSGKVKINSSLDSKKLSFDLSARLFKGSAFDESFDEAQIELVAKEGLIGVKKGLLTKEQSQLLIAGTLNMDLDADLQLKVLNGDLKTSSILKAQNLPVSGAFSAQGTITEKLGSPKLSIRSNIEDLIFHHKRYGKGVLNYTNTADSHLIAFDIEDALKTKLKIPAGNQTGYGFEVDAEDFDVAPILGYSVTEASTKDYVLKLSGSTNGKYHPNDFWSSEISAVTKKIEILYKGNRLESKLPTSLEIKNHRIFLNDFILSGNNQNVSIKNAFSTDYHSKFLVNGRINISFFKIFAPFLKRIDGTSTLHLEVDIKKDDFQLLGSSYTKDAYIEFPNFPHPFENLSADILYNQNKVLVNSITGRLAGGSVLGNGEFLILGPNNLKMNIDLNLDNINLNFPKGYATSGDAKIRFYGKEAPFHLDGDYKISSGLIEEEFGGQAAEAQSSNLLAELLKKNEQSPILLNLNIDANQGIGVKNSLVEGELLGSLKVFDKVENPKVSGEVKFSKDSRFTVQDTEFEITDSLFQFRGQTPINPTLFLTAKTRAQNYDINVFIQGEGSSPKIRMNSQPSLTDRQIISLLAFGSVSDSLENELNTANQNDNQSSIQIGTSLLKKNPLGQEIKDRLPGEGWDIQFSSVIDEGTNLAVPKFTISKKFSKKVEASLNKRQGQRSETEFKLRYDLGDNLSTVFRLRQRENLDTTNDSLIQQLNSNQVGVDLEYKEEFP